ncbi:MAG: FAD-binding oxidoreductase [Candidatus Nezhaarchaeota archaeon]|nr:FAD-binding oxidoreductase [Candidatus Nezhaarchaeota archaeon]
MVVKPLNRHERILRELQAIVGVQHVSDWPEVLFLYSWDFISAEKPGTCEFVVMPSSVEEVQGIVRLANRERIPVIPWVSGICTAGLCIPREGGIVVDLRRMNRVLEVNEDDLYALVEGGVTWAGLVGYLEEHHPDLMVGVPWAPSGTGVVPYLITTGFGDLGMISGTGGDSINGLEVVLPTGEIVKCGSCMTSQYWIGRWPLPDISGLFVGWQGTTGIVTKAAIKLYPKMPVRYYLLMAETVEKGYPIIQRLAERSWTLGIADIWFNNYPFTKAHTGSRRLKLDEVPLDPDERVKSGIPDFSAGIVVFAPSDELLNVHEKAISRAAIDAGAQLVPYDEVMSSMPVDERAELPLASNKPIHVAPAWLSTPRGGGGIISWVGTFLSHREVPKFYRMGVGVFKKYDKHDLFYGRIMMHGHHVYARHIMVCNKDDPQDLETMRKAFFELDDEIRKNIKSAARYHLSPWASRANLSYVHGPTLVLLKKIKNLLDPNGLMNPGHLLDTL